MAGPTGRLRMLAATILVVAGSFLIASPVASAAFGLSNVTATAASTDAGANSDLTLSIDVVEPERDLKNLVVHLPPGLVGNPQATQPCLEADLNANSCAASSVVGTISNDVIVFGFLPLTVMGTVHNVEPRPGEPARFGFILTPPLSPPIILQAPASLRPGDLGLDTTLDDIPNTASVFGGAPSAIDITGIDLTLRGLVGNPARGFLRNPTSCGENVVGFDATAYDAQAATGQSSFTSTNCAALPFAPALSAAIKQSGTLDDGVEVSTTINQRPADAGLERAVVALPNDLAPSQAALLNQCSGADFAAGSCPATTKAGTARATSPLLSAPLAGDIFVVASGGVFPNIGVDLRGPLALKLEGGISLTPDLRAEVTFDGLPDIPISEFALSFAGGPTGLAGAKRSLCTPPAPVFDSTFLAHSAATSTLASPATVDCTGFDDRPAGKEPNASIKLGRLGADEPTLKLEAKAGSDPLTKVKLKLPKALSFAAGEAFARGSSAKGDGKGLTEKAIESTRTSLTLTLKAKGADELEAKIGRGALLIDGKLGAAKQGRFALKLFDSAGTRTSLALRPK